MNSANERDQNETFSCHLIAQRYAEKQNNPEIVLDFRKSALSMHDLDSIFHASQLNQEHWLGAIGCNG